MKKILTIMGVVVSLVSFNVNAKMSYNNVVENSLGLTIYSLIGKL
jgi:hypothetical protein